jgi:hypothetical protein
MSKGYLKAFSTFGHSKKGFERRRITLITGRLKKKTLVKRYLNVSKGHTSSLSATSAWKKNDLDEVA